MSRKRRRPRRAPQAPQASQALPPFPYAPICRPRPFSDVQSKVFQQRAHGYSGVEVPASPTAQAAAKELGELLEQYGQEHRRWIEAETARAAAEEAAKRKAAEREARRRRRSRAAKRVAKRRAAAKREAIAAEQAIIERKAAKRKTQRAPQRRDAQRVPMTEDDVDWARTNLRDDVKKGYGLDAAYSVFKTRWEKDPIRSKRKLPSRTQFIKKVWKHRASD